MLSGELSQSGAWGHCNLDGLPPLTTQQIAFSEEGV